MVDTDSWPVFVVFELSEFFKVSFFSSQFFTVVGILDDDIDAFTTH
jgi:hypothetical protein